MLSQLEKLVSWSLAAMLALSPSTGFAQEMQPKGKSHQTKPALPAKGLTEDQKVGHLLDRVTFGARPGDLARVRQMGWQKFLEAQLHPESLNDDITEQKLKMIESLSMNSADLARVYDPPREMLAAKLKERGYDISELANGNGQNGATPQPVLPAKASEQGQGSATDAKSDNPQARQREARRILVEMGYKLPREIVEQLQQAKIIRAVYSERQMQEVMTDFWFNHFNIYVQKGADRILTTAYERDVIRPRVFNKFSDLLKATAESPAMLFYLDNWTSVAPNAQSGEIEQRIQRRLAQLEKGQGGRAPANGVDPVKQREQMQQMLARIKNNRQGRGINENYAREIMELHTLGVEGGYTQKDVQEVARCFTGWTIRQPRNGGSFYFNPATHDNGEKIVLGQKISAGGGVNDGYKVIEILAKHPSTAKFIATKLARKFVSDNPPATLVERMTQTYRKTDGDIREVLRAMFNAPEFWSAESYRAKIKTPFEMTVSAVRAVQADTNGNPQFHKWLAQMGEGLFLAQPPTGYADTAEQWVNTGALLDRMNFALALSSNRIPGTRVDLAKLAPNASTGTRSQLVDHFARLLLRSELSAQTRSTIDKSLNEPAEQAKVAGTQSSDAARIVGLLLGSPEFQRQ